MKARHLHDWQLNPSEAKETQALLASQVIREDKSGNVRLIAGVDISSPNSDGYARAAVVILSYPALEMMETKVVEQRVTFPYVPGLLSFRESPLVIAACEELDAEPDLILVDGQGIAHPRRFGLASHLGLLWDKPTIGCAKSRLCGQHDIVPPQTGAYTEIIDSGEVIGVALRTKPGVSPLYVSIGHKIDLQSAVDWVLRCCRGLRVPEPTRLAHIAAGRKPESVAATDIGLQPDKQLRLPW
ncbi:MAG: deoxyribonuclease V [Dehalococcoidia bacterium]|nr:MAG: deoxyribonuclease V [Dehalococcoidia bacterium]